jgi:hypothetical protein
MMIYLHSEFHISTSTDSLVISIKFKIHIDLLGLHVAILICPCATLIKQYATKAYGGVDVYIHNFY